MMCLCSIIAPKGVGGRREWILNGDSLYEDHVSETSSFSYAKNFFFFFFFCDSVTVPIFQLSNTLLVLSG